MSADFKRYAGKEIDVLFAAELCAHSGTCVRGLPRVFDVRRRPWVLADAESAERIAELVDRCPSGALRYERKEVE
ncbi:(4Fe-4S)-binding protein [Cohnella thailandensis]|jgi:Uncharacterized conserved protein|uniref:(4Fe-4S)-binding protein n=1 Tax=Cohnella thailandensis TaxID=557557 RepID=A0A841SSW4_9BACL|nr:(4Fe-4S)-binding protein [Cohnella thailandensis]MBB6634312.1 (4Fe-4S)-binding protein [Cohnella thailandensis]MBP1972189.1 putative Fe-S cluster protein YjdI [Cohnella thailandensis]